MSNNILMKLNGLRRRTFDRYAFAGSPEKLSVTLTFEPMTFKLPSVSR